MTAVTARAVRQQQAGTPVELLGLRRRYGAVNALDGLDLTLVPGELLALLGPSGCGKTTALRILAGLEQPDAGRVLVAGQDVVGLPAHRREMGMVFQQYSLFPNMTARDNVAFGPRVRKQPASERRRRADELLELVGLGSHGDRYPHQLSGGQQQRVALARALAVSPRVLLLDEPLSALDAQVRAQLREEIRRLQRELGITTLFVTHDQEEALSLADRVGVMRAGRLEQLGPPEQVYHAPATPFVAEFVGAMNRIPGRVVGDGHVEVLGQRLEYAVDRLRSPGAPVEVLIRPEAVLPVPADAAATVVSRSFLGPVTRISVSSPQGGLVLADVSSVEAAALAPGTAVAVQLRRHPVLVRDPR